MEARLTNRIWKITELLTYQQKEAADMERRLPIPSTFSTTEEGWTETLNRLLAEREQQTLWVSFESKPVSLSARPYRLRFDKRTLHLYESQQSPNPNQPELATVALPEPEIGSYRACTTQNGESWLAVTFRLLRDGDQQHSSEMFAQLSIATCEEFLTAPPSDIPSRSIQ
jgi:hypothetical protein